MHNAAGDGGGIMKRARLVASWCAGICTACSLPRRRPGSTRLPIADAAIVCRNTNTDLRGFSGRILAGRAYFGGEAFWVREMDGSFRWEGAEWAAFTRWVLSGTTSGIAMEYMLTTTLQNTPSSRVSAELFDLPSRIAADALNGEYSYSA